MKAVYWLPIAALAGIVIGAWSSSEELRAYKDLGNAGASRQSEKGQKAGGFDAFARLVQIPDAASRPRRRKQAETSDIAATNRVAAVQKKPEEEAGAKPSPEKPAEARRSRAERQRDLGARIAEARDLWNTRVDLARAQWKSKLKLSGESEAAFDAALQDMNDKLYDSVSALAEIVSEQKRLSPETGFRLMGETATVMAGAYDRIGECVAPELRGEVAEINMVDFIDPGVAKPLVGVQDELEEAADAAVKRRRDDR